MDTREIIKRELPTNVEFDYAIHNILRHRHLVLILKPIGLRASNWCQKKLEYLRTRLRKTVYATRIDIEIIEDDKD